MKPSLKKEENVKKRRGRKRKEIIVRDVTETVEVAPGVYEEAEPSTKKLPELIPHGISPVEYVEMKQKALIDRIDTLGVSGKPEDAVKLKANAILLNKIMPDLTKNEVKITVSPYERIKRALEEEEYE